MRSEVALLVTQDSAAGLAERLADGIGVPPRRRVVHHVLQSALVRAGARVTWQGEGVIPVRLRLLGEDVASTVVGIDLADGNAGFRLWLLAGGAGFPRRRGLASDAEFWLAAAERVAILV